MYAAEGVRDVEWIESISKAIAYIEDNITNELNIEQIAGEVSISPFYFQKGFSMLCGFTISDYIRQRRLTLAGGEIVSSDVKIIDIALKYGYDSPDSFTKAFTRFHGITPTAARRHGAMIKAFAPLKISFTLKGGFCVECKIVKKDSFTVIGHMKKFRYDDAFTEIPKFWNEYCQTSKVNTVCGMYGVNMDEKMEGGEFEYIIADDYKEGAEVPEGFVTKTIPAFTWAVFPCRGAMPASMQEVNKRIFSEWLPNSRDYEIAAGYNIEMYEAVSKYPNGLQDENYYSEIWIPVKNK